MGRKSRGSGSTNSGRGPAGPSGRAGRSGGQALTAEQTAGPNGPGSILWPCARVLIGGLLAVSGFEKLTGPYQNFAFIIEQYQLVTASQAALIAQTLPWAELIAGVFLILGLWTRIAARASLTMFTIFLAVVGQALWRRLPMDECGCFGELISIPPAGIFAMDLAVALVLVAGLARRPGFAARSVDALYDRR